MPRTGSGLAPKARGCGQSTFPAALQMWFAPSGGSWRRLILIPLAGFQGKEERDWLGGAGGAAFKMQSAQSLWCPPACWGGSAHAGGLLPTPAGTATASAAPLAPPSRAVAGRCARAPGQASPGRGSGALWQRHFCWGGRGPSLRGCPLSRGAQDLRCRPSWKSGAAGGDACWGLPSWQPPQLLHIPAKGLSCF